LALFIPYFAPKRAIMGASRKEEVKKTG